MPALDHFVRYSNFSKRKNGVNSWLEFPCIDHRSNLGQGLRNWWSGDYERLTHTMGGCSFFRGCLDGGNQYAARFQDLPGTLLSLAANQIEHDINIFCNIFKGCGSIINGFIYAKLFNKIKMDRCSADHFCAA